MSHSFCNRIFIAFDFFMVALESLCFNISIFHTIFSFFLQACPYYASRKALKKAQVVCMSYNTLLNRDLRETMGLQLEGRVVVFDEAHNLVDALNQVRGVKSILDRFIIGLQSI
jgi:hypothetical protein